MYNKITISGEISDTTIHSTRTSGTIDSIPLDTKIDMPKCTVSGAIYSTNQNGHTHRYIHVESISQYIEPINSCSLTGYICKSPIYRTTPLGKQITNLCLAVNQNYIECIAWGSVAREAATLKIGDEITIEGRMQSRAYSKGTTTEVSINTLTKG